MSDKRARLLERRAAAGGGLNDNIAWLRERVRAGSALLVTHAACDGNDNCKREPTGEWRDYTVTLGLLCCCGETEDAHGLGGAEHNFVHACVYYGCLDECECEPYEEKRRRQIYKPACDVGRVVWPWTGDYGRLALAAYCHYEPAQRLAPHPGAAPGKTGWECVGGSRGYPEDRWLDVLAFHAKERPERPARDAVTRMGDLVRGIQHWPREALLRAAGAGARAVIAELCDPDSAAHRPLDVIAGAERALVCLDAFLDDPTEENCEVWRLANVRAGIGARVDWLPYASKGGKPRDSDPDTIRAAIAQAGDEGVATMARTALLKWSLHG